MSGAANGSPRPFLSEPLPFGELDWHQPDYQIFVCSKSTASWLMAGAMTHVNGQPIHLYVTEDMGENVSLRYIPKGQSTIVEANL